jgi:uridine kinase
MSMQKPLLVAVTGGSGSGKSTIVRKVCEYSPDLRISVLQQDHYYRDLSHLKPAERDAVNFDHPDSLDMALIRTHLEALAAGHAIDRPSYDFASHTRTKEIVTMEATPIVMFDGILALFDSSIRRLFDVSVYVDVPDDVRFIRRLRRDVRERGRSVEGVIEQYLGSVKPMHDEFVAPTRRMADLVISWERWNDRSISMLANAMRELLHNPGKSDLKFS